MTLSQAANYLLPLVTLPYITRVVGPENYGIAEFAQVTMLYFTAFVSYGFVFTATRRVAELKDRFERISTVFSVVTQAKIYLLLFSILVFAALLLFVPQYHEELRLMLVAFPFVIGWALYPDFLFQGRQDLGVIALANMGIKSLGAVLIFVLIQEPDDYYWVLGINSITQLGAAGLTLTYAYKRYSWLQFKWQPLALVKAYLRSGFYMFASHFFTRVYVFGSVLFLGFLLPGEDLGYFAAALKLITVGQSFLFTPLGSSLYPHLAQLVKTDPQKYLRERKRFRNYLLLLSSAAALVAIFFNDFVIQIFFGADFAPAAEVLAWMAPVFVFTAISHFSTKQGLMVLKADGANFKVVFWTGLISVILNFGLIEFYGLNGAAFAKLGLEIVLAILAVYYFSKVLKRRELGEKAL